MNSVKKKKYGFQGKYIVWGITAIQLLISIFLGIQLVSMNLLPTVYLIGYVIFGVVFNAITICCAKKRMPAILLCVLSLLISIAMAYGLDALNKVDDTVEEVTDKPEEIKIEMIIAVLQDSQAEEITDLSQFHIGYFVSEAAMEETDFSATEAVTQEENLSPSEIVMQEINESVGGEVSFHAFSNITDLVDAMYDRTMNAVIMNRAYIDLLTELEEYGDFSERIKIIYSSEVINYIRLVEEKDVDEADEKEVGLEQFIVYISGIDTFGDVSVTSRSDVNILAVVNTKTKQIQLINTPRDYYVELPVSNGRKDKLTHAGIYGVDNSIGALENLYGIEIDYFVRMNFSGFEDIIDSLGGIDVYSEYDFTVEPIKHYTVGMNHLSGIEALAFARERHAFAAGDIQRGKNQMAVIIAMVDRLTSTEILYHYTEALDAVAGTFQTNFSSEEIYSLVKLQLEDMSAWTIETYSVTGTGGSELTYSIPNKACYVMIPNEEDVQTAKEKIEAVLQVE